MHFLAEACRRKLHEPRSLVYSRGGTAISMCFLFLAFCGYLIYQIYSDHPLIQNSSEEIGAFMETPDVEICSQNSTLSIVKCEGMFYNWTTMEIPNCMRDYFIHGADDPTDVSKCYLFHTGGKFKMATGLTYDNRNAFRRIDFYWKMNSKHNNSFATISIPAITVQLYDTHFTTWFPDTIGDTEMETLTSTNLQLGISRATSFINYTSAIYYYPQKYREIKPRDASSLLGFGPSYIDIVTLINFQHDWPILSNPPPPPPAFSKSLYDGFYSIQLVQSTIDVQTEVRQHTILAAVALAGGAYGVLTTLYILLFGMTRMTPWGLMHYIPVFTGRRYDSKDKYDDDFESNNNQHNEKTSRGFSARSLMPSAFQSLPKDEGIFYSSDGRSKSEPIMVNTLKPDLFDNFDGEDGDQTSLLDSTKKGDGSYNEIESIRPAPPLPPHYYPSTNFASTASGHNHTSAKNVQALENRTTELSNRVEELEGILREYFINTKHLDRLRNGESSGLQAKPRRSSNKDDDSSTGDGDRSLKNNRY